MESRSDQIPPDARGGLDIRGPDPGAVVHSARVREAVEVRKEGQVIELLEKVVALLGIARRIEQQNVIILERTKQIMSSTNDAAANLQAAEASIETKIAALGTAQAAAFTDLKAVIAADLNKAGVDPAIVQGIADKLNTFGTSTIDTLTSQATAADPGAQPTS